MKNPRNFVVFIVAGLSVAMFAQQGTQPQIKVNYLNVCTPPDTDKAEILSALDRLPMAPLFSREFEIARGRSIPVEEATVSGTKPTGPPPISRWVRIRKEFAEGSPYLNAQYSFGVTEDKADESLVLRVREPKDVMQVSISDEVELVTNPAQVVSARTPADRIRLERFGKSSLVLARCKGADQSAYEALFQKASDVLNLYRERLGARAVVTTDLPKTAEQTAPASRTKKQRNP